jgi:NADH:ubiquinone oxidoreductase subunit 4 (subunit M)
MNSHTVVMADHARLTNYIPFNVGIGPTAGSVILAGVLLKLGTYGFIRFSFPLFPEASLYFTPIVYLFAIVGIVYTSFTAIRQTDFKRIIA